MALNPITGTNGPETIPGTSGDDYIQGLGGDDVINGNDGNDVIDGGAGNDIITGGPGIDTLTGGPGADIFRDTAAGLNGDNITDFLPGDRIQITDLNSATTTISLNGSVLSYSDGTHSGTVTIDNVGPGRFVTRPISSGGFEVRLQQDAHNDFNGDGRSDLLWGHSSGMVTDWLGQPTGAFADNSANFLANPGTSWHVVGTGDFNGDGHVDLMWQNDNGTVVDWLGQANGGFADNSANFLNNPGTAWHVAATGDFNADGRDDILWRNDNGTVVEWLGQSNGGFADNSANFLVNAGTAWHIAATGDFNGDGSTDILWRNDNGMVVDWLGQSSGNYNGGFADNSANFLANPGTSWHVVGTGDFNGDGISDILWRNDNGVVVDWLGQSNGGFVDNSANFLANPGTNWHVAAIADVNGDSIDDLVWQNTNGTVVDWLGQANGGFVDNGAHFLANPGTSWHVLDPSVHDPFA
jgi:hypothetical protein